MRNFDVSRLRTVLSCAGIDSGDLVFVHSALFSLGRIEGASIQQIPQVLYETLCDVVGPRGTVAVPAFNFDFCSGETFDRQHTPSEGMGAFSEYLRQHPEALRSPHPMQSMAAVGDRARDLTDRDTPGAFDDDGSFDALIEYGARVLMIGCDINAVSLIHWAEQRAAVPYRFWKEFSGRYRDADRIERRTYRMHARDLRRDPEVRVYPVGQILRRRGELRRFRLGSGAVESCRARDFASAALRLLHRDPNALIAHDRPDDSRRTTHGT